MCQNAGLLVKPWQSKPNRENNKRRDRDRIVFWKFWTGFLLHVVRIIFDSFFEFLTVFFLVRIIFDSLFEFLTVYLRFLTVLLLVRIISDSLFEIFES